jgi:hypothetical protein
LHLPCEILLTIIEQLSEQSMHTLSQVCRQLQNIVFCSYSSLVKFRPSNDSSGWLKVMDQQCGVLLLWQRCESFVPPKILWFTGSSQTTDYHLKALDTFLQSLDTPGLLERIYLSFYIGPVQDSPALLNLLGNVQALGCKQFVCHGTSRRGIESGIGGHADLCPTTLEVLHLHSPLFFGAHSVSFTLTALQNSPIRELSLMNTSLSRNAWSTLLSTLALPYLSTLTLDDMCPTRDLVEFLKRHMVRELRLSSLGMLSGVDIGPLWRSRLRTTIPTLSSLDASPAGIIGLMCLIDVSRPFQKLVVRLNHLHNKRHLFSSLLDCTEHFRDLRQLQVNIPVNIEDPSAYSEFENIRTCSAREVVLKAWPLQDDSSEVLVSRPSFCAHSTHHILGILHTLVGCVSTGRNN